MVSVQGAYLSYSNGGREVGHFVRVVDGDGSNDH